MASGRGPAVGLPTATAAAVLPDPFNVCTLLTMPARTAPPSLHPLFCGRAMQDVPVPGLGTGLGEIPRFRTELGPFIGLSVGGSGKWVHGGFGTTQTTDGAIGSLEVALRLGFGLEGVLNEAGDGLVSLDLGVRLDSASTMKITEIPTLAQGGAITAAIPSRSAFTARLRIRLAYSRGPAVGVAAPGDRSRHVCQDGRGRQQRRSHSVAGRHRNPSGALPVRAGARGGRCVLRPRE